MLHTSTSQARSSAPLSKELATEMCLTYRRFIGTTSIGPNGMIETIETIAVAPCDLLNKWFFFNFYLQTRDSKKALEFYHYNDFTVIAIVRMQDDEGGVSYGYKNLEELKPLMSIAALRQ